VGESLIFWRAEDPMSKDMSASPDDQPQTLDAREAKLAALRAALKEGEESGFAEDFDFDAFIAEKTAESLQAP
jgi:hypothetical protein